MKSNNRARSIARAAGTRVAYAAFFPSQEIKSSLSRRWAITPACADSGKPYRVRTLPHWDCSPSWSRGEQFPH